MPNLTKKQFLDTSKTRSKQSVRKMGNLYVNIENQPNRYNVMRAESILVSQDLMKRQSAGGEEVTLPLLSKYVLDALGCTYSDEPADYSLIRNQTDTAIIENEAIFNATDWKLIKNKGIPATDKFINIADDPFYKLDDDLPHRVQNSEDEKIKKIYPTQPL